MSDHPQEATTEPWMHWTQGIVLGDLTVHMVLSGQSQALREEHFVVITQTCDLVRAGRAWLQLVPVVTLQGVDARDAALLKRPRYLPLSYMGSDKFGDLDRVVTVQKEEAATGTVVNAGPSGAMAREVAQQLGRKFERFPLPDEVDKALSPMARYVSSKARKVDTPLGLMMDRIEDIRLEANWSSPPLSIKVLIVAREGELPKLSDDQISDSIDIEESLRQAGSAPVELPELADELARETPAPRRAAIWSLVAEAIAAKARAADSAGYVELVEGEAIGAETLTYARVVMTERIDLDVLCPDPRDDQDGDE